MKGFRDVMVGIEVNISISMEIGVNFMQWCVRTRESGGGRVVSKLGNVPAQP